MIFLSSCHKNPRRTRSRWSGFSEGELQFRRNPKVAVFGFLFLVSIVGCGRQPTGGNTGNQTKPTADPRESFRSAMQTGRWEDARKFAKMALVRSPNDPDLLTNAAKATAMCGQKREAAKFLAEAAREAGLQF